MEEECVLISRRGSSSSGVGDHTSLGEGSSSSGGADHTLPGGGGVRFHLATERNNVGVAHFCTCINR